MNISWKLVGGCINTYLGPLSTQMERLDFSGNSRYAVGNEYTRHLLLAISTAQNIESVVAKIKNDYSLGIISETATKILLTFCECSIANNSKKIFFSW